MLKVPEKLPKCLEYPKYSRSFKNKAIKRKTPEKFKFFGSLWGFFVCSDVPTLHYDCKVLSDLGNGPNKPTVTIIGEYIASHHCGALISTWFRVRISGSDKNLAELFGDTSLMSDMFLVAKQLVHCCQTLVMDPTSLL